VDVGDEQLAEFFMTVTPLLDERQRRVVRVPECSDAAG
jgi:hypothetical protein